MRRRDWVRRECVNCMHHRESESCHIFRCAYPDNTGSNWLGMTYKRRPDDINYRGQCEWFEYKEIES